MPEVIIEIAQGRTQDQKRALIKEITEAVVRTCFGGCTRPPASFPG